MRFYFVTIYFDYILSNDLQQTIEPFQKEKQSMRLYPPGFLSNL